MWHVVNIGRLDGLWALGEMRLARRGRLNVDGLQVKVTEIVDGAVL